MNLKFIKFVIQGAWKGSTLFRILSSWEIMRHGKFIQGETIDLGSGLNPEYHSFFNKNANIIMSDIKQGKSVARMIDINRIPLALDNQSMDNVLLFNVLCLAKQPEALFRDVYRILKPGGSFYFISVFMMPLIPEPVDYERWTIFKIEQEIENNDFKKFTIIQIGERFSMVVNTIIGPLPLRGLFGVIIKAPLYFLSLGLDRLIPMNIKKQHPCPIGYFGVAQK